jgi:hypothetical protein
MGGELCAAGPAVEEGPKLPAGRLTTLVSDVMPYSHYKQMGELANYTVNQMAWALALTLGSIGGLCLILVSERSKKGIQKRACERAIKKRACRKGHVSERSKKDMQKGM